MDRLFYLKETTTLYFTEKNFKTFREKSSWKETPQTHALVKFKDLLLQKRYFLLSFVMVSAENASKSRFSFLSHHDTPNFLFLVNFFLNLFRKNIRSIIIACGWKSKNLCSWYSEF